jgi:DNA-directed RNA polymerase specialized sigma subunit
MSKMKNDWRYIYVGEDYWMLDTPSHDIEDELIDLIDGTPEVEEGPDLHGALDIMSERYKDILTQYYFEGKTLEAMGISRGVTKQFMHQELRRALKEIRAILNGPIK